MALKQIMKNFVGDFHGRGRCLITGDTFYNIETLCVPVNDACAVSISPRALTTYSDDNIVAKLLLKSQGVYNVDGDYNSLNSYDVLLSDLKKEKINYFNQLAIKNS